MGIGEQMSTTKQMGLKGCKMRKGASRVTKKNANTQRYTTFRNCVVWYGSGPEGMRLTRILTLNL